MQKLGLFWWSVWLSSTGGAGLIPGWGAKIQHPCSQKKRDKT